MTRDDFFGNSFFAPAIEFDEAGERREETLPRRPAALRLFGTLTVGLMTLSISPSAGAATGQTPGHMYVPGPQTPLPGVAVQLLDRYKRYCEAYFDELARQSPEELARLVTSGKLRNAHLAMAAERLEFAPEQLATQALLPLLEHGVPMIREAAILGLRGHLNDTATTALRRVADSDPNTEVRIAAKEALNP